MKGVTSDLRLLFNNDSSKEDSRANLKGLRAMAIKEIVEHPSLFSEAWDRNSIERVAASFPARNAIPVNR